MRVGKLSNDELSKYIISNTSLKNGEVIQSAGLAEDCSAIKSNKTILLTTDPITATGKNSGKLAILVSANDIAVSGGVPFCCLLTVIAPVDTPVQDIANFMKEANQTATENNIDIIGGHTEFSEAVNKMIVSCTMLGKTKRVVKTCGAQAGDSIVMTKSAAIEATAILSYDYRDKLLNAGMSEKEISEGMDFINKISVFTEAEIACNSKFIVNGMHDITEGGVYGAVAELAEANGLGATIYSDRIPVAPVTAKICRILKVSPMRSIGSGSILIITPQPESLIKAITKKGIDACVIGTMRTNKEIRAIGEGVSEKLSVAPDELLLINKNI